MAVSSDELDSLDSDDLAESPPSLRQICFHEKECDKSSYTALQRYKYSSRITELLTGLDVAKVTMRTAQSAVCRIAIAEFPVLL